MTDSFLEVSSSFEMSDLDSFIVICYIFVSREAKSFFASATGHLLHNAVSWYIMRTRWDCELECVDLSSSICSAWRFERIATHVFDFDKRSQNVHTLSLYRISKCVIICR